jgi:pyruvate dehydrogenase E2 component (dihydrolipoamide acetyltransferase)
MAHEVTMPRLSDSMEEGTILAWNKQVGDSIAVGDDLVEIETDKANMSYESDVEGTLLAVLAAVGEVRSVGAPIARIGEPGEEAASETPTSRGVQASPLARRLARELGVDLAEVAASASTGRVTKADVERAASPGREPAATSPPATVQTAKGEVEAVELSRLQRVAATRMSE